MNSHEQRQIDELKGEVHQLSEGFREFRGLIRQDHREMRDSFGEFRGEAREARAEIIGLINTHVEQGNGAYKVLEAEIRSNKLACDDNYDRLQGQLREGRASSKLWLSTALAAVVAFITAMLGGWAENFFGK